MKKYILSFVLMMTMSSIVFSQSAQTIHYQAIVRNTTGSVLVNLNVGVRISILCDSIDGTTVYSETHNVNTNQFGLINLSIGAGTVLYGNFSSIDWSNRSYVKTEIDDEGGTDYQLTRITRLLSVPYSLHTSGLIVTDANGNSYHVTVDTLGNLITVPTNPWYCGDPFTDSRDGSTYNTIQIGTQCWMAENLNIGTRIDGVNDQTDNSIIEKYCYNDIEDSCDVYGGLFQWDEMMQYITAPGAQGICPMGWHIPTDYEWKVLEGTVDSQYPVGDPVWNLEGWRGYDAGKNLKSIDGWDPNLGADLYGFTALAAGRRQSDGAFASLGAMTYMWISKEYDGSTGWCRYLRNDYDNIRRGHFDKSDGRTVRCIKECLPQPTQANAGPDQLYLADTITTLAGNTPTSGTGNWSVISGTGGVIDDTADPTSDFSSLAGNSYELTWAITTVCGISADTVVISFAGSDGLKKVTSDVAIDGILEESFWEISNQILINLDGSDNTASFGMLWDDNYLYIGVNVVDGSLCLNGHQGWYSDGVEICIDGNNSQGTTLDQYDRLFVKPVKSYWIQEKDGYNEDVIHQWIETNDGYSMEFAIPWSNFNITPVAEMNIGFNIAVNDDDNCIYSWNIPLPPQLLWVGNSNYYKDPSCWQTLNLSAQTVSYSEDYIALISPNGGDFCINNKITVIDWVSNGITNIDIDYSTDNGGNWNSVVTNLPAATGSYSWNVSAIASDQCLIRISEAANPSLNDISEALFAISDALTAFEPCITNVWKNYQWPYNAYYPVDPGGINGHVGNSCGPSALARILHYWEFPIVGNDSISFTDYAGHTWEANFEETTYNYDNMPSYLPENSTEDEYTDVATLFYHVATSIRYFYDSTGTYMEKASHAMNHYFNFEESTPIYRKDYTRAEWIQIMKDEIDNGRVLFLTGQTLNVPGTWHESIACDGHAYQVNGYNEDGDFYVVVGFGDFDGYYDADSLSGYAYNLASLIGLEPELDGKELSLLSPNGGEVFIADADTAITWVSNNISDIKIEYTLDNGENWLEVIASTPAGTGTYTWTVPDTTSYQCKVKLTDVTEINVYDKSDSVFSLSPYGLTLITPNGGECYVPESLALITWGNTPVSDIKIEYTIDNGSYWNEITNSTSTATGSYNWIIPDSISSQCKVKITDITNGTVYDESDDTFEIADEISHALQFDGIDDYVITPLVIDQSSGSSGVTMEAWVYPTSSAGGRRQVICTDDGGYDWSILREGAVWYVFTGGGSANTGFSVDLNTWQHLAAVFVPGTGIKFYKDGVEVIISSISTETSNGAFAIGNNPGFSGEEFTGMIDEARVWDYPRSQSEIQANMNQYLTGLESGLDGYWRMNEGTGQTAVDLSGNGNDGQLGSTPGEDDNDPVWIATNWPYGAGGEFTCGDLLTDSRDGKVYTTVEIGTQCWMAENLNLGTRIDGANDQTDNSIFEKYCHSDVEDSCGVYGGLYQWNEMMQYSTFPGTEGICPTGWHIPTDNEWKILEGTVDGQYPVGDPVWDGTGFRGFDAGKNLKSTAGWNTNTGTDLFGFTALPGGIRLEGGGFGGVGDLGYIYSSSLDSSAQSVKVDASSDLLWKLGDKTSGEYVVRFYLYFPSGNFGYYNIQHFEDHEPFESAIECNFHSDGSGELKAGGQTTAFSYNHDQWFLIEHIINLDSDVASCYINGTFIYTWQWSLQSDGNPGTNQLGAVDFYPNVSGSGVPAYYIDDVYYFDGSSVLNWDDFESYSLASYIAAENPTWWTTWSGTTGGSEDGVIVDEQANSGTYPWYRIMGATLDQVSRTYKFKERGYSVRCLLGECTPQPSQADAGPDQLNVAGTSTALAGNTPASGTGNWSVISGIGGTITDASSPTTNFSGLPGNSYELAWTITTVCGSSADTVTISFAAADGVKKVLSEVAVDGILEESFWEITEDITIPNNGSSDNTASFGVLWDDTYLYVGVNVVDGTLCTNGRQGWYDDGIEICIDGNYNQGTGFDEHDRQFIKPIDTYWIQEMNENIEGVIHKYMETDDGYSMEFAIPWSNFDITPALGVPIGLNVVVNDDDNCSYAYNLPFQLLWSGNGNYYQNPSLWGVIVLSDQTVSYTGDYIGIIDPNGGDFLINTKSFDINWVSSSINNVDIEYSTDNGANWNSIASNITASSGSYTWNVTATPSEQCKIRISDSNNSSFYDVSENVFTISTPLTVVDPLIPNIWDNYQWPYNAYYPEDPDGINGHVGNACGPSSLARILHYWEFPIVGNDELTFTDNGGFTWSANFGATTYNYDNMPPYLPFNSTEPEYTDVATLFYHAATSMHDVWGSGTDLDNMSYAMSHYFNYKVSAETLRKNYTRAEWIQTVKNELDSGRVLLVQGMTLVAPGNWHEGNSIAGHWYHCDGYNEDGDFHVVVGFGDFDGYYDADSMSGFAYNLGTLTGLEPELTGKELSLLSPDGGEIFTANGDTVITWTSSNVSDIKIEYTIDNGANWLEIIASTPASTGTYTWTVPNTTSYQCKVKLTDVTEINVYDKSDNVFSISPYELILTTPNGGECYVPGSSVSIGWENTPVADIKIEYTIDNGSYWNEITDSTSTATGPYNWIIPDSVSTQCKVKITDISNGTVYDESDNTFEITDETSHALQFDGTDDYVEVTGISFPTDDLTIEAWINPDEFDGYQEIIFWFGDHSIQFRTQGDGVLLYGEYDGNWNYVVSNSQSLIPNVWTHIAVTKQGDNCNLYINGNQAGYNQFDNNLVATTLHIGGRVSSMDRFFDGDIDELRIWTVARSQAEIEANMHNYLQGTVTGLYGCWRMNEGTGQTAFDLTANDYDGQLGSTAGEDDNDPEWIATNWPYIPVEIFNCGDPFTDIRDNQTYNTVLIDTMCWMAENLNIGTVIDNGTDQTDNGVIEKYCSYNGIGDSCDVYGGLYQWNEMMQYSTTPGIQGICPTGWHVPSDEEWKVLEGTVDSQYGVGDPEWDGNNVYRGFDAGKKLKSTSGWPGNGNGTDEYGFSVIPSSYLGDYSWIWTSTEYDGPDAMARKIDYQNDGIHRRNSGKTYGDVVRCLYDCTPQPTQADAGPDQLNVTGTSTALAGNAPTSGTGNWAIISGTGGIIADASSPTSGFSGLAGNSYELTWAITTVCGSSEDTVAISFAAAGFSCGDLFTDPRDNQDYTTVLIDTMCWMAENMNIGTRIDGVNEQTDNSIIEKYCYDNIEDSCDVYGGLYQWDEMMEYVTDTAAQGICPAGWHIPTDYEWKVLEGNVDSQYPVGDPEWDIVGWRGYDAGKNLKSIDGWDPNLGADLYGFTALAAGRRQSDGAFASLGAMTYMWISKEYDGSTGWCRYLRNDYDNIRRGYFNKSDGRTVRCLQDSD